MYCYLYFPSVPQLDDEKEKQEKQKEEEEEDVDAMLDEEFLRQYISRRMEEMVVNTAKKWVDGVEKRCWIRK